MVINFKNSATCAVVNHYILSPGNVAMCIVWGEAKTSNHFVISNISRTKVNTSEMQIIRL